VNLNISVDEDRQFYVNRIAFSGNTTTRDKVIRREVMVEEGQVFNSALWDMSLQRLNQLGYFEEIKTEDAEVKPNPTQPQVDINLKVKERGRNSIGFNGGVSGIGGSFMGISYETNNFLGFGETLGVTLQGGTRQSQYQFSFTDTYLLDRPLTTVFSTSGGGGFSNFHAHTLIPSFSRNRTQGSPIFPTGGSSLSATFEYTGGFLGGTVNYFRPTLDYRFFHPMNKGRNILAIRLLT